MPEIAALGSALFETPEIALSRSVLRYGEDGRCMECGDPLYSGDETYRLWDERAEVAACPRPIGSFCCEACAIRAAQSLHNHIAPAGKSAAQLKYDPRTQSE